MTYFDGIVVAVPRANREAALEFPHAVNGPLIAHGAF